MTRVMDKAEYTTVAPNRVSTYDVPLHNVPTIFKVRSSKHNKTNTPISGDVNDSAEDISATNIPMYSMLDQTAAGFISQERLPHKEKLNSSYSQYETYNDTTVKKNPLKNKNCRNKLLSIIILLLAISLFIAAGSALTAAFLEISQLRFGITQMQSNILNNTNTVMNADLEKRINEVNNRLENVSLFLYSTMEVVNQIIAQDTGTNNKTLITNLIDVLSETGHAFTSCALILQLSPSSPSGYYNIRSSNGFAINTYCDMTKSCGGITGGWMRVYELDMRDDMSQCPDSLELSTSETNPPRRTCRIVIDEDDDHSDICSSQKFMMKGIEYSEVCGSIIAYQIGVLDAFAVSNHDIDTNYVDGVSLTHGSSPREHIWTFAAAGNEDGQDPINKCPCINHNISSIVPPPPPFVGSDYFCDTASVSDPGQIYSEDNLLWDGNGCITQNICCSCNNNSMFNKKLRKHTTDDIEMRVCRDEEKDLEDIAIEIIEIYIR